MGKPRRVRITHIHETDAFYPDRDDFIGLKGKFTPTPPHWHSGYYTGNFRPDGRQEEKFFVAIRHRRI